MLSFNMPKWEDDEMLRFRAPTQVSLFALTCAAMAVPVSSASAQDVGTDDEAEAPSNAIIVTAQRREQDLQEVPVSLTVITDEMLESRNLNQISDLTVAAPSLQSGSDGQFAIRGVGTVSFATTLESSVAVSIDEVNQGRTFGVGAVFNDVARVEVLSGPQGLLFGKNSSAGLLNIVTNEPEFDRVSGEGALEYVIRDPAPGNPEGFVGRGVINLPVSQNAAFRFDGFYSYQEPVAQFIGTGSADENLNAFGGRAKFLTEIDDNLTVYVIGDYNERHGIAGSFDRSYRELDPNSPLRATLAAEGVEAGEDNFFYAGEGDFYRDEKAGGVQGRITYELGNGWEITNIAAWRFSERDQALDTDLTNENGLSINRSFSEYDQFTNELRVAIPESSRLYGQFGLYYLDSTLDSFGQVAGLGASTVAQRPRFPFCIGGFGPIAPNCPVERDFFLGGDSEFVLEESNLAAFGQFNFRVSDSFELIAGARVTREELSIETVQQTAALYFVNLGVPGTFAESFEDTSFTYKLGAQYFVNDDIMTYLTFGNGRKGAGFNDRATATDLQLLVFPEKAKTIEGGIRTSWLGNDLIANLSLYHTEFDNYQVQALDTALQRFSILNAGSLTTQGAELSIIASPFTGLTINAAATLQDATFGEFPNAPCNPVQPYPCRPDGTFDAEGTRLPNAPTFTGTIQAIYNFPISNSADMFVEGNYYHRSAINYRLGEPPITRVEGIDLLGASIGVELDSFRVSIFCRNCTDKRVPGFLNPVASDANNGRASSLQQWDFNSVRNIGLSVDFEF